jgi:hypothetical protein
LRTQHHYRLNHHSHHQYRYISVALGFTKAVSIITITIIRNTEPTIGLQEETPVAEAAP